jgi:hypothetical protein
MKVVEVANKTKKVFRIGNLRFIFVDYEVVFVADGETIKLSVEEGWWAIREDDTMEVWVWGNMPLVKRVKTAIHEVVELLLEGKIGLPHGISHRFASVVEFLSGALCWPFWFFEWLKKKFNNAII